MRQLKRISKMVKLKPIILLHVNELNISIKSEKLKSNT